VSVEIAKRAHSILGSGERFSDDQVSTRSQEKAKQRKKCFFVLNNVFPSFFPRWVFIALFNKGKIVTLQGMLP